MFKLQADISKSIFKNPLSTNKFRFHFQEFGWYKREAKQIKRGESWVNKFSISSEYDLDPYEIYTIREKDRMTQTTWLIEYNILQGTGKAGSGRCRVMCIPRGPVKIIAQNINNPDYFIIRTNIKKL